jgi:site-specific recombinase XerD
LNVEDLFHSRAELQMRSDGSGCQFNNPHSATKVVAIGDDWHSFQELPSDVDLCLKRKKAKRLPDFLRWPDAMRLLEWCTAEVALCSKARRPAALRDEITIRVGLYLGLRVSEIIGLDAHRFGPANRICLAGKGNKDRYVASRRI